MLKSLWLGARVCLAGGAVGVLNEQNVFGPKTDTDKIYGMIREAVPQECSDVTNMYIIPYLPSKEYFHLDLRRHWNTGVLATFGFLNNLPEHCSTAANYTASLASQALDAVTDSSDQPASPPPAAAAKQDDCDCKEK